MNCYSKCRETFLKSEVLAKNIKADSSLGVIG